MLEWMRKKTKPPEIDKSLEELVTRGRVSFISSINHDPINKTLEVFFANSPEGPTIDRVLRFDKVEGFSEEINEPEGKIILNP